MSLSRRTHRVGFLFGSAWVIALLCFIGDAAATRCKTQIFDESEAQLMFGPASRVFVGILEKVEDVEEPAARSSDELEVIVIGGHPVDSVVGTFAPRRVYKGKTERRIRVRINANTPVGRSYLVYASEQRGELHAENGCWRYAIPVPEHASQHLAFLRSLKSPGSGGDVSVRAPAPVDRPAAEPTPLEFAGEHGRFVVVPSPRTAVVAKGIADGVYRLTTPAPPGYEFRCGGGDCNRLRLYDRAMTHWSIETKPLGRLRIGIVDASGVPYPLRAQFDVYDATTRARIGRFASSAYSCGDATDAATAEIAPGNYVLGLVLAEVDPNPEKRHVRSHATVFNGGLSAKEAASTQVTTGDNRWLFRLPPALQPVRTRVEWRGLDTSFDEYASASWNLQTGDAVDTFPGSLSCGNFTGVAKLMQPHEFWSIPGQSWNLFTYKFRALEGGRYGMIFTPRMDSTLVLNAEKTFE